MITSLTAENRQSHAATTLHFHEGMNVITGHSRAGKTSLFRSFEWVRVNRPNSMRHISRWARSTTKAGDLKLTDQTSSVTVECTKGTVKRLRNKDVNGYEVNGTRLEAVGTSVPDQVTQVLNLADVNVQHQHTPHFFLSWSPPEIARYLNDICGMEAMDTAMKLSASRLRATSTKLNTDKAELLTLENEIEDLAWVAYAENLLQEAEKAVGILEAHKAKTARLTGLVEEANRQVALVSKFSWVPTAALLLDDAKQIDERLETTWGKWSKLSFLLKGAKDALATLATLRVPYGIEELIQSVKDADIAYTAKVSQGKRLRELVDTAKAQKSKCGLSYDVATVEDLLVDLGKVNKRLTNTNDDISRLRGLIVTAKSSKSLMERANASVVALQAQLDAIVPEVCSKCGQPLPTCKD